MNFATWSIRNPIPAILFFVLLATAGLWGFRNLSIQDFPDLDLPTVNVSLTEPGAAPAQLETEVARRVEDSLATLGGLKHVYTSITDGQVSVRVEFVLEKNLSDALIETKDAVDRVRSDLPPDVLPPSVSAVRNSGGAILTYEVHAPNMSEEDLSWFVDDTMAKSISAVPGVGEFDRVGAVDREVRVSVDPARLAALGVTAADVSHALQQMEQQSSGGRGQLGGAEQAVRTIATVGQASDIRALPIVMTSGRQVRLDQVATVEDSTAERTQAARLDGRPVIGFQITRTQGFDETRIAAGVDAAIRKLEINNPRIKVSLVSGTVAYTLEEYRGSMDMLYDGALLAMVVVWLFLRDWRATLVASAALPLSILPTFAVMYWLGYSLNILTLLALAIVVGILVDDAIVEIENIERHAHMGKSMRQATEEAVTEIALAVTATTLSIVAVFLPTALMNGIPGLLFKQFGWTAVIAVTCSLLVARLLTPMMAAYLLKPKPPKLGVDGTMMTIYLRAIHWCLSHRKLALGSAIAFLVLSVVLVLFIPTGFVPASDRGYTTINIELPPGTAIAGTLQAAEHARQAIEHIAGIESIFVAVGTPQQAGRGVQLAGEVRKGSMIVTLIPRSRRRPVEAIEGDIRDRLKSVPGVRFSMGTGGLGEKVQLILASDNVAALTHSAKRLEHEMRTIVGVSNITSSASLERPEIVIRPDPVLAAERGVTADAIGDVVRIATAGDLDQNVARLNLDNRQVYIRTRIPDIDRQDLSTISNMRVMGRDGPVPLSSIANLSISNGPSEIDRYDRRRYVTVSGDLQGMSLGTALAAAKQLPSLKSLPSSIALIQTGDAEIQNDLSSGLGMAIVAGVLCVFCVLVLLFGDFLQPITILSALPFSVAGAMIALFVFQSELDLPATLGLIMLMGIVSKNSILLVEYAIIGRRERGLGLRDALVDACHKRARPIIMTTVAMIAGMLPIALGFGADASFRQPMAFAVIGGLLTSTGLSLFVVPVVFTYVDDFERFIRSRVKAISRNALSPSI